MSLEVEAPAPAEPALAASQEVDQYLLAGQQGGASDVHLGVGMPPMWRRFGRLEAIWPEAEPLTAADTARMVGFLDAEQRARLAERGDADFAYANAHGRFRASVVRQRLGTDLVFRVIDSQVRTMDELGLPPHLKLLTQYHNGIVLVTGSVGSGKSTTLAAMVEEVNLTRRDHIITLEDPIEFVLTSKGCHVTQREVLHHTKSFATALRASLREDPDVIMVGEMRDLETIQLALTAAETGHLVFATLHTGNAARTLDRILDVFPNEQRGQIRVMLSESLRGVVSQQLVPRADGTGRVLALEILTNTPAVGNLIREGKTFMLPGVMQTGRKQGMQLMDDSLLDLARNGIIEAEEAIARAEQKQAMRKSLAGK
ncbi:MAG: PilT/PilU family type 4a pilus ATPase [Verrucomicrobia bacterium]|nr:PilT/PilU family type 4a pilus ATPase [Verrucomicrobiota bacterium]